MEIVPQSLLIPSELDSQVIEHRGEELARLL